LNFAIKFSYYFVNEQKKLVTAEEAIVMWRWPLWLVELICCLHSASWLHLSHTFMQFSQVRCLVILNVQFLLQFYKNY